MGLFDEMAQSEAKQGGGSGWLIDAGVYVCEIGEVKIGITNAGKKKLTMTWDVAEGPFAGTNAGSQYPPMEHLVMEGDGVGYSKYKLECISRSNPGFDAVAEANNGNFGAFVGKLVGMGIGIEHYTKGEKSKNAGEDGDRNYVHAWYDVPSVRAGVTVGPKGEPVTLTPPPDKDSRKAKPQGTATRSATTSAVPEEDEIPF